MAARVNVKFIAFLAIMVVGVLVFVAGVWYYQMRTDASRNVAMGDELHAAGEYERAKNYYVRAIKKEPGRRDYLEKLETTLLSMRPRTADEARELYNERVTVLRHYPQHFPFEAEGHLRYIREMFGIARLINNTDTWQMVDAAAQDMFDRLPPSDPERVQARLYRGAAGIRQAPSLSPEQVESAMQDLIVAVEALPDSDLGWSSLAGGRIVEANRLRREGQTRRADAAFIDADGTVRQALNAVPEGIDVARINLINLFVRRNDRAVEVPEEEFRAAAEHLLGLLDDETPGWNITECADVLRAVEEIDGRRAARSLLERHVAAHPDAHHVRMSLARAEYLDQDLDGAAGNAELILGAEQLPVSVYASMQFDLRRQAAGLLVDIAHVRWDQARGDDRTSALAGLQAARDRLAEFVSDPDLDPQMLRADGKLAFAQGNFQRAAAMFETLVSRYQIADPETLMFASTCLKQIGDIGRALERVDAAVMMRPETTGLLVEKASLELELGRLDAAAQTVARVFEVDPGNSAASRIVALLRQQQPDLGVSVNDPVVNAIAQAQDALNAGDVDTARTILVAALQNDADEIQLVTALVRLEIAADDKTAAMVYLERAIELAPENRRLTGLRASLALEDPIDALVEFIKAISQTDAERDVSLAVNLRQTAQRYATRAEERQAAGLTDAAAADRERSEHARAVSDEAFTLAMQSSPDDPSLIEIQFVDAVEAEDWAAAERFIDQAGAANADEVGGLLFRGRYEMVRERIDDAVRTLEEAVTRVPYSAQAWRLLAVAYQGLGNFVEATRAFDQSYRSNPNDLDTIRRYVSLLLQTGERPRALAILRTAQFRFVQDEYVRENWLELEAEIGDMTMALKTRDAIYRTSPRDTVNAARLATLLAETEPTVELLRDAQGDLLYTPQRWARLSRAERSAVIDETRKAWRAESDAVIATIARNEGDTLEVARLRALIQRVRGDAFAAAEVLRRHVEGRPEADRTPAMYVALGNFIAEAGEFDAAVEAFTEGLSYQQGDDRSADDALARFYYGRRRYDKAIEHFERVREVVDDRATDLRFVESLTRAGRYDDAEQLLSDTTPEGGPDYFTTMLLASIEEGRATELRDGGDEAGAAAGLTRARDLLADAQLMSPWNPAPQTTRARSLLAEYRRTGDSTRLDDALLALSRADEIRANDVVSSMLRVEVLRELGDRRGAVGELTRVLEVDPDRDDARRELIQLLLDDGSVETAIEVAQAAVERSPTTAGWHEVLGDMEPDDDLAMAAYRSAYDLRPSRPLAVKIVRLELDAQRPDYGEISDLVDAHMAGADQDPLVTVFIALEAMALARTGDSVKAGARLHDAYTKYVELATTDAERATAMSNWFEVLGELFTPAQVAGGEAFVLETCGASPDLYVLAELAAFWARSGRDGLSRAVEYQRRAIDACPGDNAERLVTLRLALAQFHIDVGDFESAVAEYEKALAIDPDRLIALNNFAFIHAEFLGSPELGLPKARHAARIAPSDGSVLDTLGWVEFRAGEYADAEQHLMRSVQLQQKPGPHVHLTRLFIETGDLDRAERHLRQASELRPDTQTRAEIDQLADDIRTKRSQGQ